MGSQLFNHPAGTPTGVQQGAGALPSASPTPFVPVTPQAPAGGLTLVTPNVDVVFQPYVSGTNESIDVSGYIAQGAKAMVMDIIFQQVMTSTTANSTAVVDSFTDDTYEDALDSWASDGNYVSAGNTSVFGLSNQIFMIAPGQTKLYVQASGNVGDTSVMSLIFVIKGFLS